MKKVYYYENYTDDFVETNNQEYKLKEDYKWINENKLHKFLSAILYKMAYIFSYIYCKVLGIKIEGKEVLKDYKGKGYFLYGNHTQVVGDVFVPAQVCNKRIYTIASPSNLGLKIIGKLLPFLGILPTGKNTRETKELINAIKTRISEKSAIVIYPEAHVWPYYTKIRPFPSKSFKFPVLENAPAFTMVTTYYKRKNRKRPGIKLYIDGPFEIKENVNNKEKERLLAEKVYEKMVERSQKSNYEYISYINKNDTRKKV